MKTLLISIALFMAGCGHEDYVGAPIHLSARQQCVLKAHRECEHLWDTFESFKSLQYEACLHSLMRPCAETKKSKDD